MRKFFIKVSLVRVPLSHREGSAILWARWDFIYVYIYIYIKYDKVWFLYALMSPSRVIALCDFLRILHACPHHIVMHFCTAWLSRRENNVTSRIVRFGKLHYIYKSYLYLINLNNQFKQLKISVLSLKIL